MATRDRFPIITIPVRNRHQFKSDGFRDLERCYRMRKRISVFWRMKMMSESIAAEYQYTRPSYSLRSILTPMSETLLCFVDSRAMFSFSLHYHRAW
jgi:hypothetical protein